MLVVALLFRAPLHARKANTGVHSQIDKDIQKLEILKFFKAPVLAVTPAH